MCVYFQRTVEDLCTWVER